MTNKPIERIAEKRGAMQVLVNAFASDYRSTVVRHAELEADVKRMRRELADKEQEIHDLVRQRSEKLDRDVSGVMLNVENGAVRPHLLRHSEEQCIFAVGEDELLLLEWNHGEVQDHYFGPPDGDNAQRVCLNAGCNRKMNWRSEPVAVVTPQRGEGPT